MHEDLEKQKVEQDQQFERNMAALAYKTMME